jgi:dienelactone hydrolase
MTFGDSVVRKLSLIVLAAIFAMVLAIGSTTAAKADIIAEPVVYLVDGQPYEGYFAINEGFGDNQPVVMVVHDWNGLGEYEKRRTEMLAKQGYAAFAVDLYGQGVRPSTAEESRAESGKLYEDRSAMRQRLFAGLEQAQMLPGVDPEQVVAMGYCFGGAAVLEMARAGADIDGYVSFHGGLDTPEGQDYSATQGKILVLHGADDPVAPMESVAQLANELTAAGVDFDMEIYGGARHSFTEWSADSDSSRYDAQADLKSWDALLAFLDETLK